MADAERWNQVESMTRGFITSTFNQEEWEGVFDLVDRPEDLDKSTVPDDVRLSDKQHYWANLISDFIIKNLLTLRDFRDILRRMINEESLKDKPDDNAPQVEENNANIEMVIDYSEDYTLALAPELLANHDQVDIIPITVEGEQFTIKRDKTTFTSSGSYVPYDLIYAEAENPALNYMVTYKDRIICFAKPEWQQKVINQIRAENSKKEVETAKELIDLLHHKEIIFLRQVCDAYLKESSSESAELYRSHPEMVEIVGHRLNELLDKYEDRGLTENDMYLDLYNLLHDNS